MANNSYNDPIKKVARAKLKDFIRSYLSISAREMRVACFPGAEIDGEEGLEVKEIYLPLGIRPENIVGLECDGKRAARLRNADLGIEVHCTTDADFFRKDPRKFDVVSLDYTSQFDWGVWTSLAALMARQRLADRSVLAINTFSGREKGDTKGMIDSISRMEIAARRIRKSESSHLEYILDPVNFNIKYKNLTKQAGSVPLSQGRDLVADSIISFFGAGDKDHPDYLRFVHSFPGYPEAEAKRLALLAGNPDKQLTFDIEALWEGRIFCEIGEKVPKLKELPAKDIGMLLSMLLDIHAHGYHAKRVERYSYVSNTHSPMNFDIFGFLGVGRYLPRLQEVIAYRNDNGHFMVDIPDPRAFVRAVLPIAEKIGKVVITAPPRIYLGSSYVAPKRDKKEKIAQEQAMDLLASGIPPKEIAECFSGFSVESLRALKAHITRGTYRKKAV